MGNRIPGEQLHRVLDRAMVKDELGVKIKKAIELIDGVLEDLGEESVALSFNGGKDCTVLLHIFAAVLYARHTGVDLPHGVVPDISVPSSPVQEKEPTDEQRCIWDRPLAAPPPLPHIPNLDLAGKSEHATHHEPAWCPDEVGSAGSPSGESGEAGQLGSSFNGEAAQLGSSFSGSGAAGEAEGVGGVGGVRRSSEAAEGDRVYGGRTAGDSRRLREKERREAAKARRRKPRQLIRSVYFTAPNPFPELEAFVLYEVELYGLDLYRFGGGMKAALGAYLDCEGGRDIKAILLGTRQNDPNGKVEPLAPTDPSWPQVLRVHPVLDWSYAEVWSFLRELDVPWCSLYDEGYTSLGSTHNTLRNPLLRKEDGGYWPAWMLQDGAQERAGRIKSIPPTPVPATPAPTTPTPNSAPNSACNSTPNAAPNAAPNSAPCPSDCPPLKQPTPNHIQPITTPSSTTSTPSTPAPAS